MAEKGMDVSGEAPKLLADSAVREADVVITMGCRDACPFYPGKRYEDWELDDPAGKDIEQVRPIRDEIEKRSPPAPRRAPARLYVTLRLIISGSESSAGLSADPVWRSVRDDLVGAMHDHLSGDIAGCSERVVYGPVLPNVAVQQIHPVLGLIGHQLQRVGDANHLRRGFLSLGFNFDRGFLVAERENP